MVREMRLPHRMSGLAMVLGLVLAAACSGESSDLVDETSGTIGPTPTETSESPSTTTAETTIDAPSTSETVTTITSTSADDVDQNDLAETIGEETFLVDDDGLIMRIAVSDGKGVEIVTDFRDAGGVFVAGLEDAGPEDPGVYISVAFEDYWYSCNSQPGLVWWYPAEGERVAVDRGIGARVSPDGTKLAFLASTECEESAVTAGEFIARVDTVVLVDRITGEKRRVRWSAAVMGTDDSEIRSVVWDANSSAVFVSRNKDVRRLALDGRDLSSADIVWKYEVDDNAAAWLVGHRADNGRLLFHEASATGGNQVGRTVEIDTLTAVRKTTPWTADYHDTSLDRQGTRILRLVGENTIQLQDGDDVLDIELDGLISTADW